MAYKLKNDLTGLYFHDAALVAAAKAWNALTLTFQSAVVIGHSCPELKHWTPCKHNRGEDRYAAPELVLHLEGLRELKVLQGGTWKGDVCQIPPRFLEQSELPDFFGAISRHSSCNHVNDLTWEDGKLTLGIWVDALANFYELTCTARAVTATWEGYGEIAWYVPHHRKKYPIAPTFGAIDRGSLKWYTMLCDILPALEPVFLSHNWLITDCCCNKDNPIWDAEDRDDYCWLTGRELAAFAKTDNSQFIGAVFSGFSPEVTREQVLARKDLPIWENPGFWYEPLNLQHPLANVELVPWDSTYLLFLSHDKTLVDRFRAAFPGSEDLVDHIHSWEEGKK